MGFVRIFWKNNVQEVYLPKMINNFLGVDPKKFRRVCIEFSKHNWARISETICPQMLIFLQVGLLHIVLSEYPDKSHDFKNFIFTTSHLSALYRCLQAENNGLEILFY